MDRRPFTNNLHGNHDDLFNGSNLLLVERIMSRAFDIDGFFWNFFLLFLSQEYTLYTQSKNFSHFESLSRNAQAVQISRPINSTCAKSRLSNLFPFFCKFLFATHPGFFFEKTGFRKPDRIKRIPRTLEEVT